MSTKIRKNRTIKVYEVSGHYEIPEKASEFMAFWQSKLDAIPPEFTDSAIIEIETGISYGDPSVDITVTYERPESDSEMDERVLREKRRASRIKETKLANYEKLKQELGLK